MAIKLRALATSSMPVVTIDAPLMKNVGSTPPLAGQDRAALLAIVGYGCSYNSPFTANILSVTTNK